MFSVLDSFSNKIRFSRKNDEEKRHFLYLISYKMLSARLMFHSVKRQSKLSRPENSPSFGIPTRNEEEKPGKRKIVPTCKSCPSSGENEVSEDIA
ncbi:hypothetical protein TNCV_5126951 [Trichonephila clavipes]|nr:hypothetical protein TNCV_5126951 [Trichonephila clavipes]